MRPRSLSTSTTLTSISSPRLSTSSTESTREPGETFEAAVRFARSEGIIPAPEPAHAIRAVVEEVERGQEGTILFSLCGHGHFDLSAYEKYLAGTLEDYEYPDEAVKKAQAAMPKVG